MQRFQLLLGLFAKGDEEGVFLLTDTDRYVLIATCLQEAAERMGTVFSISKGYDYLEYKEYIEPDLRKKLSGVSGTIQHNEINDIIKSEYSSKEEFISDCENYVNETMERLKRSRTE